VRLSIPTIVALLLATTAAFADDKTGIIDQKRELEQLQNEMRDGQRRLDSLQTVQKRVQNQIAGYDQKISSDRKVIRRLNKELDELKRGIAAGDSVLAELRILLDRQQRRYLGGLRQFYMAAPLPSPAIAEAPNQELERQSEIVYLTALAGYESSNIQSASQLLTESTLRLEEMSGQHETIRGLKKDRETSYALGTSQRQKQEKNLEQLRRKSLVEADRVMMLQQAAEEMTTIITRLEETRSRSADAGVVPAGQSVFAGLKGRLPSPYKGKITEGFGNHTHPVTRLKSFSPGITIEGKAGRSVTAVAAGKVAYAGSLRGYGNFVIINHDHQYYTTYAGLGKIIVSENQFLQAGDKLGESGSDGTIKFELRQGREPQDPVEWIDFESL
jgi:murein hydrolase activator